MTFVLHIINSSRIYQPLQNRNPKNNLLLHHCILQPHNLIQCK